jgi:starch synthase
LGVHTEDFVFTDQDKAAVRASLEVDADTLVVLFMGRLSFHAKAHPLAMYQALETAAKASGKSVVLIECGWHANDFIAKAYVDAALLACPSVRMVTLDGRKAEDRHAAWAAADVFCSLADNIQETFGITPIEAMAAGLPVVVSDWDGYKDTVRDGIDGFRIPTTMPAAGLGADLAYRHALDIDTYDMYCGHTSSLVAVDIAAAANAFTQLFSSPELRQRMGAAGRQRAREVYDWQHIIAQYEALWAQLTEIRLAQGQNLPPPAHCWPARMDPFYAFASYPTRTLLPETVLRRADADVDTAMTRIAAYEGLAMVNYAKVVLPTEEEMRLALTAAEATAAERVAQITEARRPYVFRSLTWHIKLGVLRK